jgi:thiosulfate/3-mercaptopyruvate sulfurtransferase
MGLLISPQELADLMDREQQTCLVFDCRSSLADKTQGKRDFDTGHIPGAQFADLESQLSTANNTHAAEVGRHPLPERTTFIEQVRDWGISNDTRVVCYDQNNGAFAARMWWMLRWLGHDDVYVLDGGLDAWLKAGLSVDTSTDNPGRSQFTAGDALTRIKLADDLADTSLTLMDARDMARFSGESEPIDPVAGHIPGARCAPFSGNLGDACFLDSSALKTRFEQLGFSATDDLVCYCGSGVTAAHNILALLVAGFPEPALYPGSWSEWITDPDRPIETG